MTSVPDRQRFARQIALPEIGVAGQARLGESRVRAPETADPRAARWAIEHAVRAGALADDGGAILPVPDAARVRAIAGHAHLEEAAAFYLGALAALEHVRREVLGPEPRPIVPLALGDDG